MGDLSGRKKPIRNGCSRENKDGHGDVRQNCGLVPEGQRTDFFTRVCFSLACMQALLDESAATLFKSVSFMSEPFTDTCLWLVPMLQLS